LRSPTRFGPCSAASANTARMAMKITRCTMHNGQGSWCLTYCRYRPKPISPLANNAPHRYSQRLEIFCQSSNTLFHLIYPSRLYRLEHLFAAAPVIVIETFQIDHPVMQINKAHSARVDPGMLLCQRNGDIAHVYPFHVIFPWPC